MFAYEDICASLKLINLCSSWQGIHVGYVDAWSFVCNGSSVSCRHSGCRDFSESIGSACRQNQLFFWWLQLYREQRYGGWISHSCVPHPMSIPHKVIIP